jgi:hypothetical protein
MKAIMGFVDIFKRSKTNLRCTNCQVDRIHGSLLEQFPDLQLLEAWKFGHLYQCSRCSCSWFLPEHKQSIRRIHDNLLPLAHYWNQTPLTLKSSTLKMEVSMRFAPVGVVDKKGTEYTLPCESHFFDSNHIKGEEISLSGREKKWKKTVLPSPAQAFYFVDWFDGCEEILLK